VSASPLSTLIFKRASVSRLSGEWNDDDFDVLADGVIVGRIMKAAAVPVGMSWMWTLAFDYHEDRTPTHGDEGDVRGRRWRHSPRAGGGSEGRGQAGWRLDSERFRTAPRTCGRFRGNLSLR
jgi:hypothetical protein